jgi:hypothetical protein
VPGGDHPPAARRASAESGATDGASA